MIDGIAPTGAAWGMATTGILGWIARVLAVLLGLAILTISCVTSIPMLLVAYPVHIIRRRRKGRPLTWVGSWLTTVLVAAILTVVVFAFLLLQPDRTGATAWHQLVATATQPQPNPPPPPRVLRYFPGATTSYSYHPHSPALATAAFFFAFAITAEFIGACLGSLAWGGAWLVVSGWTGRLAGVRRASPIGA